MIPIITKHYGFGLLAGVGFGLFLAGIVIESRIITDDGSRRLMSGIGLVGMIVGGTLYALSLRKQAAGK